MGWPYPPDSYEELMYAAMAGNGCTECLATTHTARDCHYNNPEIMLAWDIGIEIDRLPVGTMVEFPTYEEISE
jgi:hypothetical protein